jgi:hypothetical protein
MWRCLWSACRCSCNKPTTIGFKTLLLLGLCRCWDTCTALVAWNLPKSVCIAQWSSCIASSNSGCDASCVVFWAGKPELLAT